MSIASNDFIDSPATAATRPIRLGCGNCGFSDQGRYCSRCGEPLHAVDASVPRVLWDDLVVDNAHQLFALVKTTWMILAHPIRFFDGVLREKRGMADDRFFPTPVWTRISDKPLGVQNAVRYWLALYAVIGLASWLLGVEVVPPIRWHAKSIPEEVIALMILFLGVAVAFFYATALSLMMGRKIPISTLTKFVLYLNSFALMLVAAMIVAGSSHPAAVGAAFLVSVYVLFGLPYVALPRVFRVSRLRLFAAQIGAAILNVIAVVIFVFLAAGVYAYTHPSWSRDSERMAPVAEAKAASVVPTGIKAGISDSEQPEARSIEPIRSPARPPSARR